MSVVERRAEAGGAKRLALLAVESERRQKWADRRLAVRAVPGRRSTGFDGGGGGGHRRCLGDRAHPVVGGRR